MQTLDLAGFGATEHVIAVGAAGALLEYAKSTQGTAIAHVRSLTVEQPGEFVRMDPATRRNLEISETLRGEPAPTLLSLIDTCATGMGSRLAATWLHHPLRDREALRMRHGAIAALLAANAYEALHALLRRCVDVERITARVALKSARPRDLSGLRDTLEALPALAGALQGCASPLLIELTDHLAGDDALGTLLKASIRPEPAAVVRDGGVIADGLRRRARRAARDPAELRRLPARPRNARTRAHRHPQPARRIQPRARLLHRGHAARTPSKVPDDYRRRQTLKNAERYITPELKAFEDKALSAQDRALAREKSLYEELLDALQPHIPALQQLAARSRSSTCWRARRARAQRCDWRARVRRTSRASRSKPGAIRWSKRRSSAFIANDCGSRRRAQHAAHHRPEHGRQVDLHAAGGADRAAGALSARSCRRARARLGPIDQIFTRIGAADDLAGGRSTFMVEMTEAA